MTINSVQQVNTINGTNQIRLVLVEDHIVTAEGLKGALQAEDGLQVIGIAKTAEDGLRLVRELQPDVVMLDLHLPDSTGPKSLLEKFVQFPNTKIIVFSSETRLPVIQIVLQFGVAGYLLKSEPPEKIADAVRKAMRGEKTMSEGLVGTTKKLSRAELHLLRLLARGMRSNEIAEQRVVAPATVRKQIELLIVKLDLANREELIAWAVQNGYAEIEGEP
jgi:two-component system response regulator DesR